MAQQTARRNRKTVRLDGQRLRDERADRDTTDPHDRARKIRFTQQEMAELIGIGLSAYQKAEAGECIDEAIARRIAHKLELDETDIGFRPCTAAPPPDTSTYLNLLHKDCSFIDVRGLIVGSGKAPRLPIEQVYIPLRAVGGGQEKGGPGDQRFKSLEQTLEHRKLVIVGDPGGGKSTFLKRLAYEQSGRDATQFPILIRIFALEEFIHSRVHGGTPDAPDADSADWLPRYLEARGSEFQWGLDAAFFRGKLREPSTLILLDGLDEVPNAARREAIARLFERATKAYRDARFVVTTRPAAYEGKATLDEFETVRIGDLDTEAVEGFLDHWSGFLFNDDKELARRHNADLLGALRARPEIRRMARNPLMLTALAVIQWNDRQLPEQRADLYESILKWLSEAHDYPNRPHGQKCLAIFGALALGMQCHKDGRVKQIEKAEAAKLIAPEFREVPEERRQRESAALEFLESEFVDSGIVASRGNSLEFWHLTFQEYLAARACADFPESATPLFEGDRWRQQEWREVMLLVPGVLIRNGMKRVDAIFNVVLDRAERPSAEECDSLAIKARAAGLLGAALQDLRPSNYRLPDQARYNALLNETLDIFDKKRAVGIDLRVRVEAAEALGQAGDLRLKEDNWVTIPGGTFLMGAQKTRKSGPGYDAEANDDEGPVREVSLTPFQMGRYPVTVEEYRRFVEDEENGHRTERCWVNGGYSGEQTPKEWDEQVLHPNRPVVNVNWFEAAAYCEWLTAKTGKKHRLPTEAEWEFAARGPEGRKYPWGNEPPDTNRANYDEANVNAATPVGLFPSGATPEGIHDMAGNVWEWTADWYNKENKYRVVRGGSWIYASGFLRAALRYGFGPESWLDFIGFRCAREA